MARRPLEHAVESAVGHQGQQGKNAHGHDQLEQGEAAAMRPPLHYLRPAVDTNEETVAALPLRLGACTRMSTRRRLGSGACR